MQTGQLNSWQSRSSSGTCSPVPVAPRERLHERRSNGLDWGPASSEWLSLRTPIVPVKALHAEVGTELDRYGRAAHLRTRLRLQESLEFHAICQEKLKQQKDRDKDRMPLRSLWQASKDSNHWQRTRTARVEEKSRPSCHSAEALEMHKKNKDLLEANRALLRQHQDEMPPDVQRQDPTLEVGKVKFWRPSFFNAAENRSPKQKQYLKYRLLNEDNIRM